MKYLHYLKLYFLNCQFGFNHRLYFLFYTYTLGILAKFFYFLLFFASIILSFFHLAQYLFLTVLKLNSNLESFLRHFLYLLLFLFLILLNL